MLISKPTFQKKRDISLPSIAKPLAQSGSLQSLCVKVILLPNNRITSLIDSVYSNATPSSVGLSWVGILFEGQNYWIRRADMKGQRQTKCGNVKKKDRTLFFGRDEVHFSKSKIFLRFDLYKKLSVKTNILYN